jgi:hypothetical protein
MIRRTTRPTSNYYILNNATVADKELSWAARGLLVFLLTKPDNWRVSPAHLVSETKLAIGKQSGRDHVYTLLSELIAAGYIAREQIRDESGKIDDTDYIVNEAKIKDGFPVAAQASIAEKTKPLKAAKSPKNNSNQEIESVEPLTDSPDTVKPDTANTTLTSNEIKQITKKELLPTLPAQSQAASKPTVRSSFSFDPNSLEIEIGIMNKTESKAVKEYLAKSLETQETAQIVLDEVVGKIRAGKAAGHDKPIKTIIGYTTTIVSRLHQGGFVESHAISERTRRERLALIEQSKAEFTNAPAPCSPPSHQPPVANRTSDEMMTAEAARTSMFGVLGMRKKIVNSVSTR